MPSDVLQIERKKYYLGDWNKPKELPPSEIIEKELAEVMDEQRRLGLRN